MANRRDKHSTNELTKTDVESSEPLKLKLESLDDILPYVGDFGPYQWLLLISLFPYTVAYAFLYFGQFFLTLTPPEHWCHIEELESLQIAEKINRTIPPSPNYPFYDTCHKWNNSWAEGEDTVVSCTSWEYNLTSIPYISLAAEITIAIVAFLVGLLIRGDWGGLTTFLLNGLIHQYTENIAIFNDWVCDRAYLISTAQSIFFCGSIVGGLFFGWLADRRGRIPALVLCNGIALLATIATAYADSFWNFALIRFFTGLAFDNCINIPLIIVIEYVAVNKRSLAVNGAFGLYFAAGTVMLPWAAYFIADWRILCFVTAVPLLSAILTPWILPESARWYLAGGMTDRVVEKLKRIARFNKKTPNPNIYEIFTMPRTASVTVEEATTALKKYADHFTETELPRYTSVVWTDISKELHGKWNAHSVYTNVREDRREILTLMRKDLGIYLPDTNNNSENYSFTDTSAERSKLDTSAEKSTLDITENTDDDPDFRKKADFQLVIENKEWKTIKPEVPVEYKDRKYFILEPKVWTHTIFHLFWKRYRLPCAYNFKRAKVHPSPGSENYLIIHGICKSKQCSNKFVAYIEKKPDENEDVIVEVHTRDTSAENHEIVRRPLSGTQRSQVSKELVAEGCSNWRKKIAREEMDIGDVEPPLLYKADVLRQAKKEKIEKDLGVGKTDGRDIVRAIEEMMVTSPYTGSVQAVGSNPFHTFYRSQVQLHAYKEYLRLKKDSAFISIDATGSVVQALPRGSNKSGHIFLYAIVINFDGCSISVNQMLSERNETEFIEFWLKQWVRHVPKPPETVCDYSRALLCALAFAFNNQTIKSYVNSCFLVLTEESEDTLNTKRPSTTFLRVDVAHLIHLVTRWKCFTPIRQTAIKDFFIRCVALMVDCQTFDQLEEIYLLTSIVAIHPYNGDDSDVMFTESAKSARKKLESYIAVGCTGSDKLLENDMRNQELNIEDFDDKDEPVGRIEQWVERMQSIAENGIQHEAEELNAFYLPNFFKRLQHLIKEFPLWTGVMIPYFDSKHKHASSSYCEGYFNDLKTRVMTKFGKPLRADKFLKMHLQDLSGGARIFSSKLISSRIMTQISRDNSTLSNKKKDSVNAGISHKNEETDDFDLKSVENWRNKGSKEVEYMNMTHNEILELNLLESRHPDTSQSCLNNIVSSNEVDLADNSHAHDDLNDSCPGLVNLDTTQLTSPVQNSVSAQDVAAETIQRRSKYFRPFPEIEHINNLNSKKKAYLLKNGNISSPLAIERVRMSDGKMVQRKLIVYNTCAFDSIVQVLLTSALDYKEYKDIIEKSTNETLQFVLQFMTDGPSADVMKSRAAILKPLYSHTIKAALEVGGVTVIESLDAWGNVTTVWNQLMQSEPSAHTTQECSNASCPTIRTEKPFLTINHKAIAQYRFNLLEKAVQFNSYVKSTKCKNEDCSGRCTISQQLNNHLFIELDVRGDMSAKQGMRCQLKDLPDKVQLSQKDFRALTALAFDGHVYSLKLLPGSVFVSFSLASATELPAGIILILTLDRWGRRFCAAFSSILAAVCSILLMFVTTGTASLVIAILIRFLLNMAANVALQYAAELLPTPVRAQGVSLIHIFGIIAHGLAPYVIELARVWDKLPMLTLGMVSTVTATLVLFLPETMGEDMPQTLQEGEDFGKNQKFWSVPCCTKDSRLQ